MRWSYFFLAILLILASGCTQGSVRNNPPTCNHEQLALFSDDWQVAWSVQVADGYISDPPLIVGDYVVVFHRLFESPSRASLRAYNIHTAIEMWASDPVPVENGTLSKYNNTYFALYAGAAVSVIDLRTGGVISLRTSSLTSGIFSLALGEDVLYWHDYSGNISAIALPNGELLWEVSLPDAGRGGSMHLSTDNRLIIDLLTGLWVLDAETGSVIEQFPPNSSAYTVLYNNMLLVGEGDSDSMKSVSIETGETIWENRYRPFIGYEQPTLFNGNLYFIGEQAADMAFYRIYATSVSLNDGKIVWQASAADKIGLLSGIDILKGTGYAIFEDGTVRSIDLDNGKIDVVLQSEALAYWGNVDSSYFPVPGLAASDEMLFASFGCSTLYAFRPPP